MIRPPLLLLAVALLCVRALHAQGASPYLTPSDWMTPVVENLIQLGVIDDPTPLSRPMRRSDVLVELDRVDTAGLPAAVTRTVERLRSALEMREANPAISFAIYGGGVAATHARRESLRETGDASIFPNIGADADAVLGPIVMASRYIADRRFKYDPDYTGNKSPTGDITMMVTDAYVGIQGKYGQLTFGSVARSWGPAGIPGLVVSAEPYPYDHLFLSLGTSRVRVETIATELDSHRNDLDERVRRFWSTSRLLVAPFDWLTFTIDQASLWSGVGRGAELWWVNPLKVSSVITREAENEPDSLNSVYSGSVHMRLPRGAVFQTSLMIDDLASLFGSSAAPDRMGTTAVLDVPLSGASTLRLSGMLVSSLAYRSPGGFDQAIMRRGVGLGHNFADYYQLGASLSLLPLPMTVVRPHIVLLKQGEGDFRDEFPPTPATDHPFLFEGNAERTWRFGVELSSAIVRGLRIDADAGLHNITNVGHVAGMTRTKFVGRLAATYRIELRVPLQ